MVDLPRKCVHCGCNIKQRWRGAGTDHPEFIWVHSVGSTVWCDPSASGQASPA